MNAVPDGDAVRSSTSGDGAGVSTTTTVIPRGTARSSASGTNSASVSSTSLASASMHGASSNAVRRGPRRARGRSADAPAITYAKAAGVEVSRAGTGDPGGASAAEVLDRARRPGQELGARPDGLPGDDGRPRIVPPAREHCGPGRGGALSHRHGRRRTRRPAPQSDRRAEGERSENHLTSCTDPARPHQAGATARNCRRGRDHQPAESGGAGPPPRVVPSTLGDRRCVQPRRVASPFGDREPDGVELVMPYSDASSAHPGVFHGGAIATLIDTAGGAAVMAGHDFDHGSRLSTVAMSVQYLAAARGRPSSPSPSAPGADDERTSPTSWCGWRAGGRRAGARDGHDRRGACRTDPRWPPVTKGGPCSDEACRP